MNNQSWMTRVVTLGMSLAIFGFFRIHSASASIYSQLTADQQADIQAGKQVVVTEDDENSAWPKIWTYQKVAAAPDEVMAVGMDYNLTKTYVPSMSESQITKQLNPVSTEIEYTVDIKEVGAQTYTLQADLTGDVKNAAYQIVFSRVSGDAINSYDATAASEPLEGGGSLLEYYTLISPTNGLASFFKDQAVDLIESIAQNFAKQVVTEKTSNPTLLATQLKALHQALGE